jgi:hypothetical protein
MSRFRLQFQSIEGYNKKAAKERVQQNRKQMGRRIRKENRNGFNLCCYCCCSNYGDYSDDDLKNFGFFLVVAVVVVAVGA